MLTLLINLSDVSAANSSFNTTSLGKSAGTIKSYVETKHAVPETVTVAGQHVTSAQYLYLLTSTVQNINTGKAAPVTLKNVSEPTNPSETVTSGTLTKSEYLSVAGQLNTYMNTNAGIPNYVSTSLGNMRYENLVYTYSMILNFYTTQNRLPNTVSVSPWITTPEGSPMGFNAQSTVDSIGYSEAKFRDVQGQSSPTVMDKVGYGDCWADSGWLYNKLSAAGVPVRIMETSSGGLYYLHRWVQINVGNEWQTWNYAKYNSQHCGALGSGFFVVKSSV